MQKINYQQIKIGLNILYTTVIYEYGLIIQL